ncbi:MAG: hypothetical protein IJR83_05010 [Clostridia bacterium]|nr:hypothetical protein [Clostridia bacterium]
MAYIRDRKEELTGFQESGVFQGEIDIQSDFVMVYRMNDSTADRIRQFREAGYVIHLMVGISWGAYGDYLDGQWDGKNHRDESQEDRFGNRIMHGSGPWACPYMVPTISFADYLSEKLRKAVDMGVEAIHVEEPEFWDRGGYSPAFKREYLMYYKTPWVAPHTSADARYKCAKLKAYLYRRTIDRVASSVKSYGLEAHDRLIRFYVPTHSLLNYTQWKIVSPEASLTEVPAVDGYIAQIWTGTSREKNAFEGKIDERTFETAYLEYGVMQELVKGTGRQMWFLHDPIEDQPCYDWDDYQTNYLKTVTASLLHPYINTFEICPWPRRVFEDEKYPRNSPDARTIGDEYRTLLMSNFQLLGDIPKAASSSSLKVGLLLSDTSLYQRDYPDGVLRGGPNNEVGTVLRTSDEELKEVETVLFAGKGDMDLRLRYEKSNMLPGFYGLGLPLLKYGLPIRPVLLDNARRFVGYLNDYQVIVMSYEYCKPDYPDENAALATWVREGGTLLYVGNGQDPYHRINSFWTGKYPTAAEHLFDLLGITAPEKDSQGVYNVGKGLVAVWNTHPSDFTWSYEKAQAWRDFFGSVIRKKGYEWTPRNYITEQRGPYLVAAVFSENKDTAPLKLKGFFTDMYSTDYMVWADPELNPGENRVYFDFSKIEGESLRIIGTSARVFRLEAKDDCVELEEKAAALVKVFTRIRVPFQVSCDDPDIRCICDPQTRTVLISYDSRNERRMIRLQKTGEWN